MGEVKISVVDMAEVRKLEQFIDGQMYAVVKGTLRGLDISVVLPAGTLRGWATFYRAVRQFARAAWPHLRP